MEKSIQFCSRAATLSTDYEKNNSDLKRRYLINNVRLYNYIVKKIQGNCGSFGTGYPFYALKRNLLGQLPVIDEQIRYNDELVQAVEESNYKIWNCADCLLKNGDSMPDLKQVCKPCPNMDDALKPRKILNRLPDMDLWMVCKDGSLMNAEEEILKLFKEYNIQSSDVDPLTTIEDIKEITTDLEKGIMPVKHLPFDSHIIEYSTLYSLIEHVPFVLEQASKEYKVPYLPIHPLSYRKDWQYDDTAYNFIHDYLSSFTEFNFEDNIKKLLKNTRNYIANNYSFEELYNFLITTGPDSVARRHKTLALKECFRERVNLWKK